MQGDGQEQPSMYPAPMQKSYGGMTGYLSSIYNRRTNDGIPMVNPYKGVQLHQFQSEAFGGLPETRSDPFVVSTEFNHVPRSFIRSSNLKLVQTMHHNRGPLMSNRDMKDSSESRLTQLQGNSYLEERLNTQPDGRYDGPYVWNDPYSYDPTRDAGRNQAFAEFQQVQQDYQRSIRSQPVDAHTNGEKKLLDLKAGKDHSVRASIDERVHAENAKLARMVENMYKSYRIDEVVKKYMSKIGGEGGNANTAQMVLDWVLGREVNHAKRMEESAKEVWGNMYNSNRDNIKVHAENLEKAMDAAEQVRKTPDYKRFYQKQGRDPLKAGLANVKSSFKRLKLMSGNNDIALDDDEVKEGYDQAVAQEAMGAPPPPAPPVAAPPVGGGGAPGPAAGGGGGGGGMPDAQQLRAGRGQLRRSLTPAERNEVYGNFHLVREILGMEEHLPNADLVHDVVRALESGHNSDELDEFFEVLRAMHGYNANNRAMIEGVGGMIAPQEGGLADAIQQRRQFIRGDDDGAEVEEAKDEEWE